MTDDTVAYMGWGISAQEQIDGFRREVRELRDENAKLREERDHWHVEQVHAYGNWEDAHKRATELELENAKLRGLVLKLYANLRNRETILELMGMPPSEAAKDEVRAIIDKCSELGVEVDG